ncbi:bifunctional DNA primase/polymerase [Streptomyces sp. 1222.5]|uniref:bifunctional DNA primase/polymerase n=1 Tax=Streptomyces sp. 1222.5 TaxID=1881026 RepID=UPI003D70AA08
MALTYARMGWAVFPLRPLAKVPATPNGFKDASTDPAVITAWWTNNPTANIGIATGASDLFVIDVDTKNGKKGAETLAALEVEHGTLPETYTVKTWSGGWQHYFQMPEPRLKNSTGTAKAGLGPDVDTRGDGGYVVAAPSVVEENGVRGQYWGTVKVRPAALPEWVADKLTPRKPYVPAGRASTPPADQRGVEAAHGFQGTPEGLRRYIAGRCEEIRRMPVGSAATQPVNDIAFELAQFTPHQISVEELRTALRAAVDTWEDGHERGYAGIEQGLKDSGKEPRAWEERQMRVTDQIGERPTLKLGNAAECAEWLRTNVGTGLLSGMFLRNGEVVFTPRQGEDGYRKPDGEKDDDGPAQVRMVDASRIASTVQWTYTCIRTLATTGEQRAAMFPKSAAQVAVDCPEMIPNLRVLKGVTHTPLVRRDGSVLSTPGYDPATRLLYLPSADMDMPAVPENPTREQVREAVDLLSFMMSGFPFVHDDHRANDIGYLLTPLLRELLPPPYKAFGFNARQPGSGKTLMSTLGRIIHGGVFRGSTPEDEAEMRKQVTSILDQTTGPIVVFDNVTKVLQSATLAALLTSASYSDRRLGASEEVTRRNDRVWSFTGNNCQIGGDLPRRTILIDIDPGVPHPEERTGFAIDDIESWTAARRGELLRALLILVRAWVVNGMEYTQAGSDSFSRWVGAVRAILASAGIAGVFDSKGTRVEVADEDDEWADFLEAAERVRGDSTWPVTELLKDFVTIDRLTIDCLPADLAKKVNEARGDFRAIGKSLGRWLKNREGRWAREVTVRSAGKTRTGVQTWRVERHGQSAGFAGFEGFGNHPDASEFGSTSVEEEKKQSGVVPDKPSKPSKPSTPGRPVVLPRRDR